MHSKKNSNEPPDDPAIERRGQPRNEGASTDWETIVLKRVTRHVESLSSNPSNPSEAPAEPGWEESALLALRRRIRDLKAD